MSGTQTCEIDPAALEKLRQFRFKKASKGNAAVVFKIDRQKLLIEEDEEHDDITLEDLVEELPENTPRYVILSYELKHPDGRNSFPLVFIYWSPSTVKAEMHMLYASAKSYLQVKADVHKTFDIRDADQLTDEWLASKLLPSN
ncbi:hypothetical protein BZG36_02269 [Bifiguratus adelaidae]|uniref:ADF-H domain-containing protein n=1 Tax=Bifiguratus adelaidae TaxID=1938954 RepID=A0A261XY70_9FUNG|nr:hypothetical protein BZG36_02269 [Bifiguratus adelaidae]